MAPVTPTYLVGCDNRDDTRVFSGSTYHLARQGMQDGVLTAMLNLYPRGLAGVSTYVRAGLWKMQGGWHGRHGFKFTDFFLDPGWKRCLPSLSGAVVVNNFQLFGSHFVHSHDKFGIRPYFYIDGTLEEYFQNYMQYDTSIVDKGAMASAMAAERDGYAACLKVIAMSRRTAELLTQNYSVPRTKIYIVPPGANIPEDRLEQFDQNSSGRLRRRGNPRSLTLGFIGLYPERKGLPTIAAAVGLLRRAGYDVRLHVIGKCPANIAEQNGVTYFGMIDKRTGLDRPNRYNLHNRSRVHAVSRRINRDCTIGVFAARNPHNRHRCWRNPRYSRARCGRIGFIGEFGRVFGKPAFRVD